MTEKQYHILIVDDERLNLNTLGELLGTDYEIRVAKSGEQAIKRVFADTLSLPDLILLDIMMPGMDGYEVCRRLKADSKTQNIPIIFISAMSDDMDEAKGLELGAVDYITKPISPPIVLARVKTHLKLKQAYDDLENQNAALEKFSKELETKNKALEEAALLRDNVERIIRHDLKTPLNGILGFSSLLFMNLFKIGSSQAQEIIKNIEKSGYQMLEMINRSLDLYKMEMGTYQYSPDRVDILRVLKKIVAETQTLAEDKSLSVEIRYRDQPLTETDDFFVLGEYLLCYSMLANLIKNAIEASPNAERITVFLDQQESTAKISVHNQGAVPIKIRDKFFDKYTTAGKVGGTGLGTYSAKLLAQTQGGSIQFETSEEAGTTVTVLLQMPK